MPQIICKDLELGYDGKAILSKVNFSVNSGDYLCIIGENGSGKTTLMRALLSLAAPISGSILYGDGLKSGEIGYLPQQTQVQKDFPASVLEIVLSGCRCNEHFSPFYTKKQKQCAKKNLQRMEIGHLAQRSFKELSGGQKQRVLLARALCAAKKALILDEPTAALDLYSSKNLYKIIKDLNRIDGITIIMVSHDPACVYDASHILHLGKTVFFNSRDEYLRLYSEQNCLTQGDVKNE